MFSINDIQDVYNSKVALPNEYFKKYEKLPPCPIKSFNYKWNNNDFPRNWATLDFIEWTKKYNLQNVEDLAYTCEVDPELEFVSSGKKTLLSYPQYDLHTIDKHFYNEFSFFVFNQTLEHLYNPFLALSSIYTTIKSGGYIFTSVPTLNIPHMTPVHFTGFTPMGLAMLFKSAGFEICEIGQWGNYEYIQKLWANHSWPGYEDLNKNGIVVNEERNVCQCWILARKPE